MFTPNFLSVRLLHFLISFLTCSASVFIAEIIPKPPASETAAARLASDTHAIPPWNIGYLIPIKSQIFVLIIFFML